MPMRYGGSTAALQRGSAARPCRAALRRAALRQNIFILHHEHHRANNHRYYRS